MQTSVIVPVRDEESSIKDLLEGLLSQSSPPFEIVITDGGSRDNTPSLIQQYINRGAPVRLIRGGPALPGRGRNLAAAAALGEWLAFIDAGVRPEKDWLERLERSVAENPKADVVYGSYDPITDSLFKECAAIAYVPPPMNIGSTAMRPRSIASALMRKVVWEKAGGFPEHLRSAEDLLFMQKAEDLGFVVAYAPEAKVHWNIQPGMWTTFKRFVLYAENNIRAGLWRQWQARIFFRYGLLLLMALPTVVFGLWWLTVPLVLWLMMLLMRGVISLRRNSQCYPAGVSRTLARLILLVPIIAVIDAAAIVGTVKWFLKDNTGDSRTEVEVRHGG
jgi:glycosyltransferase involved in cell wall biosynthesis